MCGCNCDHFEVCLALRTFHPLARMGFPATPIHNNVLFRYPALSFDLAMDLASSSSYRAFNNIRQRPGKANLVCLYMCCFKMMSSVY